MGGGVKGRWELSGLAIQFFYKTKNCSTNKCLINFFLKSNESHDIQAPIQSNEVLSSQSEEQESVN